MFFADEQGWTALHFACFAGSQECVRELLAHKNIDIDALTQRKQTPLHLACAQGNKTSIVDLLEMNAKVKVLDSSGRPPFALLSLEEVNEPIKVSVVLTWSVLDPPTIPNAARNLSNFEISCRRSTTGKLLKISL